MPASKSEGVSLTEQAVEPQERTWVIYGLRLREGTEYRYVGYTSKTASIRLEGHKRQSQRADVKPTAASRWVAKHLDEIVTDVLEECPVGDLAYMQSREVHWIAEIRSRFRGRVLNGTDGGYGGTAGRPLTDDHREAISRGLQASPHLRRGPHSDEVRAKMSASHAGVPLTEQTRMTMSDGRRKGENHPRFGATHTPEAIEKMRVASTGRKRSEDEIAKAKSTYQSRTPEQRAEESRLKREAIARRTPEERARIEEKRAAHNAQRTPEGWAAITTKRAATRAANKANKQGETNP